MFAAAIVETMCLLEWMPRTILATCAALSFIAMPTNVSGADLPPTRTVLAEQKLKALKTNDRAIVVSGSTSGANVYENIEATIRIGDEIRQRIRLDFLNWSPRRDDAFLSVLDFDGDGNDDFLIVVDDSVHNKTWQLFRHDSRAGRFVADKVFVNPTVDAATACVVEHGCFSGSCASGTLSVRCWKDGRWQLRFVRAQSEKKINKIDDANCGHRAAVRQTDYSVHPPRAVNFALDCGAKIDDRLPSWVKRIRGAAASPALVPWQEGVQANR